MGTGMHSDRGRFIDGSTWRRHGGAGGEISVGGPATSEALGTVPAASALDTREAIEAADLGFARWCAVSAWTRADVLRRVADAMAARAEEDALDARRIAGAGAGLDVFAGRLDPTLVVNQGAVAFGAPGAHASQGVPAWLS